ADGKNVGPPTREGSAGELAGEPDPCRVRRVGTRAEVVAVAASVVGRGTPGFLGARSGLHGDRRLEFAARIVTEAAGHEEPRVVVRGRNADDEGEVPVAIEGERGIEIVAQGRRDPEILEDRIRFRVEFDEPRARGPGEPRPALIVEGEPKETSPSEGIGDPDVAGVEDVEARPLRGSGGRGRRSRRTG